MATRWWVYLLECRDGSLYAGATNDVGARLQKHNAGKGARYTRSRRPVVLRWKKRFAGRSAALKAEYSLKRLPRAQKLALVAAARRGRRRRRGRLRGRPRRGRVLASRPNGAVSAPQLVALAAFARFLRHTAKPMPATRPRLPPIMQPRS